MSCDDNFAVIVSLYVVIQKVLTVRSIIRLNCIIQKLIVYFDLIIIIIINFPFVNILTSKNLVFVFILSIFYHPVFQIRNIFARRFQVQGWDYVCANYIRYLQLQKRALSFSCARFNKTNLNLIFKA